MVAAWHDYANTGPDGGSSWRCEMLYDGFTRSWRTSETQNTQLELIAGEPCVHAELKVVPIM